MVLFGEMREMQVEGDATCKVSTSNNSLNLFLGMIIAANKTGCHAVLNFLARVQRRFIREEAFYCIASFYRRYNKLHNKRKCCNITPTKKPPGRHACSFKHLTIRNRLPAHGFIPSPSITQKLLVSLRRRIQFLEIIRFPIGRNVKRADVVVTPDKEGTADGGVVVLAEDEEAAKEEFAGCIEAVEESRDQVRGLED